MKILVGVKRVIDYNVRVQLKRDGSGVMTDGVKMSINPFDEIAIEEALRIREKQGEGEVVVISIGGEVSQQQLRTALAMGADRAILVQAEDAQPLTVARILHALVERESADLVLLGKQAIDDDCNQTGQMLAAIWDRPQATFISELELGEGHARAVREIDSGLETVEVDLPAVFTVDLRLNEPRFVRMPDIMKAKRKPLDTLTIEELGIEQAARIETLAYAPPPARDAGVMVADVPALVAALKSKGAL